MNNLSQHGHKLHWYDEKMVMDSYYQLGKGELLSVRL